MSIALLFQKDKSRTVSRPRTVHHVCLSTNFTVAEQSSLIQVHQARNERQGVNPGTYKALVNMGGKESKLRRLAWQVGDQLNVLSCKISTCGLTRTPAIARGVTVSCLKK